MTNTQKAHEFLRTHGMHPDQLDMEAELRKFRANMENGLAGKYGLSDCKMLPAYVTVDRRPPQGEKVLTLDVGGTNLRAALVSFTGSGPVIEELRTRTVPGLGAPITRAGFLREVAEFAAPLAGKAARLGYCFSYQAEVLPGGDGKVMKFSKEVVVDGGDGMLVCQELLDTLKDMGLPAPGTFAMVNDTVAALLGGCAASQDESDGWIGLILGTGNNICYLADTDHIKRPIPGWTAPSMVVNMESGVYSGFPQGTFDRELDAASTAPGTYGNEKMVGGVYQGEVLSRTLAGAGELFSAGFADRLSKAGRLTAADLSAFAMDPTAPGALADLCVTQEDRDAMDVLTDCLLERAAKLVTITLAGPMEAENMGKAAPAHIVAEGSTFWKNAVLRGKIEKLAEEFIFGKLGRRCTFISAESPNLTGAALAALTR